MTILIARHGQTDWNVAKRWQSRTDVLLNNKGRAQADKLGSILVDRGFKPAQVISSPLARASETAEILCSKLGKAFTIEPRLHEIDVGHFEGRFEDEIKQEDPAAYEDWRESCFLKPAPEGESIWDAAERIQLFVRNLDDKHGDILIVGHQGINIAIKALLSQCFTLKCLKQYRQSNEEIDLWQIKPALSVGRLNTLSK